MITTALMVVIATVVVLALIVMPVVTTKYHIQRYLAVEYKYSNAEMMMLELMAYPEIRRGLGLYAAGLDSKADAAGGAFDKGSLEAEVAGVLDKLVPAGGCYALYYDSQPYGMDSSWTTIVARDKAADGSECNTADLASTGKAFVPLPQGSQAMLVLRTL
jgi:hypothetical protein